MTKRVKKYWRYVNEMKKNDNVERKIENILMKTERLMIQENDWNKLRKN